jgi:hypothetical protein
MPDFTGYRLGRLPHDPDALAAAPRLLSPRYAAIAPPPTLDRSGIDYRPRLFGNDALPDCSAAGLANGMLAQGALGGIEPVVLDGLVPTFYAGCVGVPATFEDMAATEGAVLLDVLQRQARGGFDVGEPVPLFGFAGTVPTDRASIAHCMAEFGGCYVGVDLYERDMEGAPTLDDDGVQPSGALVGGHCMWLWDYLRLDDRATGRAATWGTRQPFTWRWMMARIREAHGVWWRQLMPAVPTALDEARLAEALATLVV